MSRYFQVYKFTREDGVHDGRWLSATGDGAMRWVSTRGDAHKLTRREAESLATYIARVLPGGVLVLVVGDAQSPLEALAKPSTAKRARSNPAPRARRGRQPSARKAASSGARSSRPAARRAGGPRFRYLCQVKVPGARALRSLHFTARSDASATAYCNGLLRSRLPKGARAVHLERQGAASSSAKGSKKKR